MFVCTVIKVYHQSFDHGNYFRDTDGNTILDLDCPLTLGYNNDEMINARDSPMFDRFL